MEARKGVDAALAAVAEGVLGVASRLAFLPPGRRRPWLPESANEWTLSASIDDEPLEGNATNLLTAMARLAAIAAALPLVPPDALLRVVSLHLAMTRPCMRQGAGCRGVCPGARRDVPA